MTDAVVVYYDCLFSVLQLYNYLGSGYIVLIKCCDFGNSHYCTVCYICNMGRSNLLDMYMHEPEGRRPEGECIRIKANHDCTCYI